MEARKITIVSTKTQKKSVIMSGAETLGELKNDLRNAGIDFEDMTFYEGTSKTELKTNESVLPKDVPYTNRTTGETINTNELVFMLTNTNKKIRSGAMTRKEAYDVIRKQGLQVACLKEYGKNFTVCSTNALIALIEANAPKKRSVKKTSKSKEKVAPIETLKVVDVQAREAIRTLANILNNNGDLYNDEVEAVLRNLNSDLTPVAQENYNPDSASPYSDNEIDAMFSGMC